MAKVTGEENIGQYVWKDEKLGARTDKAFDEAYERAVAKRLEDTQPMRVVALDEACNYAKNAMTQGHILDAREITKIASVFAQFLINGQP